jgi:hypothetical protein
MEGQNGVERRRRRRKSPLIIRWETVARGLV